MWGVLIKRSAVFYCICLFVAGVRKGKSLKFYWWYDPCLFMEGFVCVCVGGCSCLGAPPVRVLNLCVKSLYL